MQKFRDCLYKAYKFIFIFFDEIQMFSGEIEYEKAKI